MSILSHHALEVKARRKIGPAQARKWLLSIPDSVLFSALDPLKVRHDFYSAVRYSPIGKEPALRQRLDDKLATIRHSATTKLQILISKYSHVHICDLDIQPYVDAFLKHGCIQ